MTFVSRFNQTIFVAARDVPIVGFFPARAIRKIERNPHLIVEQLRVSLSIFDGIDDGMQKPAALAKLDAGLGKAFETRVQGHP